VAGTFANAKIKGPPANIRFRVPIPKFVAFFGATFRTSESKGH
jgi:hypothetical protein